MVGDVMDNATIAHKLLGYAQVLQREQANLYRVRAYRKAAEVILAQERPLTELSSHHLRNPEILLESVVQTPGTDTLDRGRMRL